MPRGPRSSLALVRLSDVREVGRHNLPLCNVLVGGFPCQDLSVAGKRAGLAGERSGLFWEFVRIASELHPEWLVLENVPGLLSSNEGRDMGAIIGGLEDAGYRCAWRVLDSQWFGVAQRRRRVFIVGHADVRRAVAVLFEPESGARHPATVRKAGSDIAHALDARTGGVSGEENQETFVIDEFNQTVSRELSPTLDMVCGGRPIVFNPQAGGSRDFTGCADKPGALLAGQTPAVAYTLRENERDTSQGPANLVSYALNAHGGSSGRLDGESETFIVNEPLTLDGVRHMIERYAVSTKANAEETLRLLRDASRTEAATERFARELVTFQSSEVLRQDVHGEAQFRSPQAVRIDASRSVSCEGKNEKSVLCKMRGTPNAGCSPSGREPAEQRREQLASALQELPLIGTRPPQEVRGLWRTPEGARLLQQTLDTLQEIRRCADDQDQPTRRPLLVRRLVPTECERLQGFPDGWTCDGLPSGDCLTGLPRGMDGRRYRQLGNAMTVAVLEWLGRRIVACVKG